MKRFRAPFALCVGATVLAGCEFPSEAPSLEQQWVIPVDATTIGVDEMLPAGVTISGADFAMTVDPFSTTESLGNLCALCLAADGLTVPKPAFASNFDVSQNLPADVVSASLTGGSIDVSLSNNFGFDPIRLPSGATGSITITLTDGVGGTTIGQVIIDGAAEPLATGTTVTKTMALAATTIANTIVATVGLDSPAGTLADMVTIDAAAGLAVSAVPGNILIGSATVNVASQTVNLDPQSPGVDAIDQEMTDRIVDGAMILEVANPFGVSVDGSVTIGAVNKALSISSDPTSTIRIPYTGDELRSFLGQDGVQFFGSGTVSAPGPITVSPDQQVTLDASVEFTILIG